MLLNECTKLDIDLKSKLNQGSIMVDFERAMITVLKDIFKCEVRGCRFHLGQSWWKKIKELGLSPDYRSKDSTEGKWLRGLFGLSLLPDIMVRRVFNSYCSFLPSIDLDISHTLCFMVKN